MSWRARVNCWDVEDEAGNIRVHSLNVPSRVRTLDVLEIPGSVRGDFRRFSAVLINFGRFQRRYTPDIHLVSRLLSWYGALFIECNRSRPSPTTSHAGKLERPRRENFPSLCSSASSQSVSSM